MSADNASTYLHHSGTGAYRNENNGANTTMPSGGVGNKPSDLVAMLLGNGVVLTDNKSFDLDRVYGSAPHNSLGLQVAISGRADVVQADVAAHLSE